MPQPLSPEERPEEIRVKIDGTEVIRAFKPRLSIKWIYLSPWAKDNLDLRGLWPSTPWFTHYSGIAPNLYWDEILVQYYNEPTMVILNIHEVTWPLV